MKADPFFLINRFLRTCTEVFTAKDLSALLYSVGVKISAAEIEDYIFDSPNIFTLEDSHFITRAGAFTNQYFSFVPTVAELDQKLFVAGDRCLPFVDDDLLSSSLIFFYKGRPLAQKKFEIDCNSALTYFSLFGDEYASQYIASDPLNANLNLIETGFKLPSRVRLLGFSMEEIFRDCDFKAGDRLLCRVKDWNGGVIEIRPIISESEQGALKISHMDFARQQWKENLEKFLLESFDELGPCSSIEEQLASVFYDHREELCVENCASIGEFLEGAKKVGLQLYGVETRLWRVGQDVPAVGLWNREFLERDNYDGFGMIDFQDFVIDSFIKDMFYKKKDLTPEDLAQKIFPKDFKITNEEKRHFALNIKLRRDILKKKYNWFADFNVGDLRSRALDLYLRLSSLIYKIDSSRIPFERFPQQELVTLGQLFSHILDLLESIDLDPQGAVAEENALYLSLEGMEFNFEDISEILYGTVEAEYGSSFRLV